MIKTSQQERVAVYLAQTAQDVEAAQRLRYQVFYEEFAAKPDSVMAASRLDIDDYDEYADHLIVVDHGTHAKNRRIVGTYRLLPQEAAQRCGQFYSSDEYDLSVLLNTGTKLLELGRSCVLPEYRTRPVLQLLWQGIADYISENQIGLMFGCASLHGTDIQSISAPLSYLHHYHAAPPEICPRALKGLYINMNIIPKDELNPRQAFKDLPPLIKGYLRTGAKIGDGAVIDPKFNTTDVCVVMPTEQVTERYKQHYERKIQKSISPDERESGSKD